MVAVIKKNRLFSAVALAYLLLLVFDAPTAFTAFNKSLYYVVEMIEILPAVFVLTSLIEAWVPREKIIKGFGKDSGFRGNILSLLIGSLSAGPIYAAFPVGRTLLIKGASIDNIIIILSSWAVLKVPMLLNEAKFLGLRFMITRWILTVVLIYAMAQIFKALAHRGTLVMDIDTEPEVTEQSLIVIKHGYCVGCKACVRELPTIFKDTAHGIEQIGEGSHEDYQKAVQLCPTNAIGWSKAKTKQLG